MEAYGGRVRMLEGVHALVKTTLRPGKVGLLIGGGSGHEPLFAGFIGENMADGAACGNVFAAPGPDTVFEATRYLDQGRGRPLLVRQLRGRRHELRHGRGDGRRARDSGANRAGLGRHLVRAGRPAGGPARDCRRRLRVQDRRRVVRRMRGPGRGLRGHQPGARQHPLAVGGTVCRLDPGDGYAHFHTARRRDRDRHGRARGAGRLPQQDDARGRAGRDDGRTPARGPALPWAATRWPCS